MPVEVREMIIRAVVNAADEKSTSKRGGAKTQASKTSLIDGLEELARLIKNKNER